MIYVFIAAFVVNAVVILLVGRPFMRGVAESFGSASSSPQRLRRAPAQVLGALPYAAAGLSLIFALVVYLARDYFS